MEKLTNEQKEAVLDAINGKESLRDIFEDRLRRAGLLEPEETVFQKTIKLHFANVRKVLVEKGGEG